MDLILEIEKIDDDNNGIYLYVKDEVYSTSIHLQGIPVILDINENGDVFGIEIIDSKNIPTYEKIQEKSIDSKDSHRLWRYGYHLQKGLDQCKELPIIGRHTIKI